MSSYFVDTSALAKRYVIEVGTQWVRSWIRPSAHHEIIISELAMVEMFAVLERRQRSGALASNVVTRLRSGFVRHLKFEYISIQIDTYILQIARKLVRKYPLRTLDTIQLGCALRASTLAPQKPIIFISGDNDLLGLALAEGFLVDNPNNHP